MKRRDIIAINHFSFWTVLAVTRRARRWLSENVTGETTWLGDSLFVEPRYIGDLVAGMREAGLDVSGA